MSDDTPKLRTHSEVKADKRAEALRANMRRRKTFVKSQKEQQKDQSESTENAEPTDT